MKTTVVFHSADFDGLFCQAIARKFLGDQATYIGWNFGDDPLPIPEGTIYVMDLPVDRVFGVTFAGQLNDIPVILSPETMGRIIWIDHHKSSIETHPAAIPGYRIDGVAACRLCYQWFQANADLEMANADPHNQSAENRLILPEKQDFVDRLVSEPLAVRLAGEYDIWDKKRMAEDPRIELFQSGLKSRDLTGWFEGMLSDEATATVAEIENRLETGSKFELLPNGNIKVPALGDRIVENLLKRAEVVKYVRDHEYAEVIAQQGFNAEFDGLKFLCCCSHELDIRSQLFAGAIRPEHDALCGFTYTGKGWRVSLYHAPGKEHHDLSAIAKKYGGGGHCGAAGMNVTKLPFNIINA